MISGRTGVFGLLGSPVEHSLSPAMHNASFERLGLDYVYVCHEVTPEVAGDAIAAARAFNYVGLNVTMPCKRAVIPFLDELSPAAELIGAVNTIKRDGDKLVGHNTDGAGMLRSIEEAGFPIAGSKVVVIGTGGAGSAIFTQAALDGAARVDIFNRADGSLAEARVQFAGLSERAGVPVEFHELENEEMLAEKVSEALIVIDATIVGMAPLEDISNVKKEWMHPGQAIVDTVYHPLRTKLLELAEEAGATPIEGLGMLLWQAALAEEIWLDAKMPVNYIRELIFNEAE